MKRFITATALTTALATGAFAASEAEITTIQQYVPNADVQALDDAQVDMLMSIANGGDSDSNKAGRMEAYLMSGNEPTFAASEAEMAQLRSIAPTIDFSTFTDAEMAQAVSLINSGDSRSDILGQLRAFEGDDNVVTIDPLTEAERTMILSYDPDLDIDSLTAREILTIQTAINSGDRSEIQSVIASIAG